MTLMPLMSISIPANAACFLYLVNDISNFQIFNYQSLDPSALTTPLINSLNPHNNYFNLMGYQTTDFINEFGSWKCHSLGKGSRLH